MLSLCHYRTRPRHAERHFLTLFARRGARAALFQRLLGIQLIQKPASSGAFVGNLRDFEAIRDVLTSATLTALIDLPFFLLFVVVIASIALVQAPLARNIRGSTKESSQRPGLAVEAVEGLETRAPALVRDEATALCSGVLANLYQGLLRTCFEPSIGINS